MGSCAARLHSGVLRADADGQRYLKQRCDGNAVGKATDSHNFRVQVLPSLRAPGFAYDVELRGPNGLLELRATRTLRDFGRTWSALRQAFPPSAMPRPALTMPVLPRGDSTECDDAGGPDTWPAASASRATTASDELERWLNEACRDELIFCSRPLQDLLGIHRLSAHHTAPGSGPGLITIAECHQPLLLEIVGFLAGTPRDFVHFGAIASCAIARQVDFVVRDVWRDLYARRWKAFADCLRFQGCEEWQQLYRETLFGRLECTLEVFDREKKLGFAMAAMAARVQFEMATGGYVARYLSASEVRPENISHDENYRLRFCPPSACASLRPGLRDIDAKTEVPPRGSPWRKTVRTPVYPYRVLEGVGDLRVGQGVELQWKMQFGSPFGWWFGCLEELRRDPGGETAVATLTFNHFPSSSRWHRLLVRFGDSEQRPCTFGGYTGGIRGVTLEERQHWMRFFPKEPLVF